MAIREIVTEEDEVLYKNSRPVVKFDQKLHMLIDDMIDTLVDSGGVGLAAVQIGILRQVVLVMNDDDEILELVNPEIIETSGSQTGWEGCLSVPGMYGRVTCPEYAKVRAQDRYGNFYEVEGTGLTARCFCHEINHLSGHLFKENVEGRLYSAEELDAMERGE